MGSVACGLVGLTLGGCVDCIDDAYYACVTRYDPFYGYYNDCHWVTNECHDRHHRGSGNGCTADYQCEPGDVCNASGECVRNVAGGTGAGGESADASTSSGAMTGAGGASGSTDAGASSGAATSSGGRTSGGSGGATSRAGATGSSGGTSGTSTGGRSSSAGATSTGGTSSGTGATSGGGASSRGGSTAGGGAGAGSGTEGGRVHRLDFACVRDTQCGAGKCTGGICYIACESDSDCGTADRCSVETGRRLCMPDPNPPVRCDESASCRPEQTCVNGACHDPCTVDTDCKNLADRCVSGLCFPDRRPISECVLNVECAADLVCLDGRCVHFGGD